MESKDEGSNAYDLLGLTLEATEAEIKTAYRKQSLKVHPDRHPNNPDAAHKFHELNQAYELLLDSTRRTTLDASLRVKFARKERFANFDVKRKEMQNELEQAEERAMKRAKKDKEVEQRQREEEAERIKEEGRKMREEREKELSRKEEEQKLRDQNKPEVPKLGPLDTTVRVKYQLSNHPTLTTPSSLASLFSSFGTIDISSIVISMKPPKKSPHKPPKVATALIPFEKIGQAHAAVCASCTKAKGLKDIEVSWAEGKEPKLLDVLKRSHQLDSGEGLNSIPSQPIVSPLSTAPPGTSSNFSTPSFSFNPSECEPNPTASSAPGMDYESITLMRLRQAERERLERKIREEEAVN